MRGQELKATLLAVGKATAHRERCNAVYFEFLRGTGSRGRRFGFLFRRCHEGAALTVGFGPH